MVSICIPSYNYARYIGEAIESALQQTYCNLEVVVIDNCSTDDTEQVVARYMATDKRVRFLRNEKNVGPSENLNRCLQHALGEYIKILCADDWLSPTCLERSVPVLAGDSTIRLVSHARQLVDSESRPCGFLAFSATGGRFQGNKVIDDCLFDGNLIGEPTAVLFRRQDALRGFDTSYRQLIDMEMWFYLLQTGDFVFIAEKLCSFRQHEGQQTKANMQVLDIVTENIRLLAAYGSRLDAFVRWQYRRRVAYKLLTQNMGQVPFRMINQAIAEITFPPIFYLLLPFQWATIRIEKILHRATVTRAYSA